MPLERLPDRFDTLTHEKLDRAVDNAVSNSVLSRMFSHSQKLGSLMEYTVLLTYIAASDHSEGDLDPKFRVIDEAAALIGQHEELQTLLASAWEHKSYREIRSLAILKVAAKRPTPRRGIEPPQDLHKMLSESFGAEYRGAVVDGFYEYLTYNEKLFREAQNPRYYAKFCSIVQSSGTGKSRMLTELSKKDTIVLYMNLREEQDRLSFPARDLIPAKILTEFPATEGGYRTICCAFFIALFETVQERLSTARSTRTAKAKILEWSSEMCDMSHSPSHTARNEFFAKVLQTYTKVHADLIHGLEKPSTGREEASTESDADDAQNLNRSTARDINDTADKLKNLSLSDPTHTSLLLDAHRRMASRLESIFPGNFTRPKLVIAVDEAHPLTPMCDGGYRPADVFCRIVNEYSHNDDRRHAIWVVFASTTSRVADFSPPNKTYNSDRVSIEGEKLFPPYTQLGWDQSAFGLRDVDVEDASKLDHIAGFGRPLWGSLKTALRDSQQVIRTASSKLCGGHEFDATNTSHVLAVLGQRFAFDVALGHPDSIEHLENGVASHMRICLATTLDRSWRFTSYPSEPLLSYVAARDLHSSPQKLEDSLKTMLQAVNAGMIDQGQRGELASRLLWLLAKDLFIRTKAKDIGMGMPSTWDGHLADCQMIPVVDWLEFIFGPQIWDVNGEDNGDEEWPQPREAFKNAYINFSHWVSMDAEIGPKDGDGLGLGEWTLRHWTRTSAVQCCHQQRLIDKAIPIYFKGEDHSIASAGSRMSQILISDKARKSTDSRDVLTHITRRHESIGGASSSHPESLPYIAILADLGQPPSVSITYPKRNKSDRCMRIYAAGIDVTTYPFLATYGSLMKTLRQLVHIEQIPETERPYEKYLNAQVKFGRTATAEHMLWEHGKDVPKIP